MGICDGRIVAVTGAGNGIGREHALLFGREGAKVVVNDVGGARDGTGSDAGAAQSVVDEIVAAGGSAVANTSNIATHAGAKELVDQAIDEFGDIHAVVNNAGILRDRMLVNMTEDEWDAVIAVHLKGTYGVMHHAAAYWRDQSKAGKEVDARIINTSSASGVFGNIGQSNYGAAKAGIAAMTIITAGELARYGVTVNAISPTALTRMTEDLERFKRDEAAQELPAAAVSPLVVWLASSASAGVTGRVFGVRGGRITVFEGWVNGPYAETDGIWDPAALSEVVPDLVAKAAPNAGMDGVRRS
ncbi:MAG TPA: SDR family oxidoreductase [Mycobacteriales bacterium]|nr:SDR family oxidoreductase [Mycobacteriales bacterium]